MTQCKDCNCKELESKVAALEQQMDTLISGLIKLEFKQIDAILSKINKRAK